MTNIEWKQVKDELPGYTGMFLVSVRYWEGSHLTGTDIATYIKGTGKFLYKNDANLEVYAWAQIPAPAQQNGN